MDKVNSLKETATEFVRPHARECQLGGAVGVLAGVCLVTGFPGFLKSFRWTVGPLLTGASALTAYLGDRALNTPPKYSTDAIAHGLERQAYARETESSEIQDASYRATVRRQLVDLAAPLSDVDLTYLLEAKHNDTRAFVLRFGDWIHQLALMPPADLRKRAENKPYVLRCGGSVIFRVILTTSPSVEQEMFVICPPVAGTISDKTESGNGALTIDHKVAREHCDKVPKDLSINPAHLRDLLLAVLCGAKQWKASGAIIRPMERNSGEWGEWGVGVVLTRGPQYPMIGIGTPVKEARDMVNGLSKDRVAAVRQLTFPDDKKSE